MTFELSEDILEAILNTGKETVKVSSLEDLASGDKDGFGKAVTCLKDNGYLKESADGVSLTDKGTTKAAQIARKHAVLASFLTEVLGNEPDTASKEACLMEHTVSTETIDKLDTFLEERNPAEPDVRHNHHHWRHNPALNPREHDSDHDHDHHYAGYHRHNPARDPGEHELGHSRLTKRNPIVPLSECSEGSLLHVAMIKCFSKNSRLIDLGVIPGELITLRRKLDNNAVVITVKGCDIALSPEVTENILVERCNPQ